jgi:hypothetical protein
LPSSVFEFGAPRELEGTLREYPFPALLVARPGDPGGQVPYSTYVLAGTGKRGAAGAVAGLHGARVRLKGTLAYRDGATLVEVDRESIRRLDPVDPGVTDGAEDLGVVTLSGEIVDSKCFLGVMNPGERKPHRDCAVRCISGGVPPMLVARDAAGNVALVLLAGCDGRPIGRELLDLVAEPVTVTGRAERTGDVLVLRAHPSDFRRAR